MNATIYAARLGIARGLREFRNELTAPSNIGFQIFFAVAFVVVLFFQRDSVIPGTTVSLAMATLPGVLGMMMAVGVLQGAAGTVAVEREDGTLLRSKAVPRGMIGHLVSKIVSLSMFTALTMLIIFVPGLFLVPELLAAGITGFLTVALVFVLGVLALLPSGAIIGSLVRTPNSAFGLAMLPIVGLSAISGIFYPIAAMPGWVQVIAQIFPVYWLGLGMRSAFLPDAAAAAEIGESWRHLEMLGVLGAWAIVGLLIAPGVLRRMARKESGSAVEARREAAMKRVG